MQLIDMSKIDITLEQFNSLKVSKLLVVERKKNMLTYDDVSSALDVSPSYVFRIEKGKVEPRSEIKLRIVALFNLKGEDLKKYLNE